MNTQNERKLIKPKSVSLLAVAMMVMVAIFGCGMISTEVAAASGTVTSEFVPVYRDATYIVGDNLQLLDRMDKLGDWNLIGDPAFSDSMLVCQQNEGINITVSDDTDVDESTYYEFRFKANSTAAAGYMELDQFGSSNDTKILLNTTGSKVVLAYYDGSATLYEELGTFAANTWYRASIEISSTQTTAVYYTDAYVVVASAVVTDNDLLYTAIDSVILKQTSALHVMSVDYIFGSSDHEEFVAATLDDSDVNTVYTAEETFEKFGVDFSDSNQVPGSYSDEAWVHTAVNSTMSTDDLEDDRSLNMTDLGEILGRTQETTDPVSGTAIYQGWEDLKLDNEATLLEYLADAHNVNVDEVTVIDYYISSASIKYSYTSAVAEKVQDAAYNVMRDELEDIGVDVKFSSDKWLNEYDDVNYVYVPTTVSQEQFDDSMELMSDYMREKTIGLALIVPEGFDNITYNAVTNPDKYTDSVVLSANVWNNVLTNVDSAYQFTDAVLGQILTGAENMVIDIATVQTALGWDVMEDGKATSAPLTVVTQTGSEILVYTLVIILVIIAIVGILILLGIIKLKNNKGRK